MATPIKELDLHRDFRQTDKDFAHKALLALAGVVIGVVAILFLSTQWAAAGVGLIFVSAYCLYHMADKHRSSKYYLTRAKQAISSQEIA